MIGFTHFTILIHTIFEKNIPKKSVTHLEFELQNSTFLQRKYDGIAISQYILCNIIFSETLSWEMQQKLFFLLHEFRKKLHFSDRCFTNNILKHLKAYF